MMSGDAGPWLRVAGTVSVEDIGRVLRDEDLACVTEEGGRPPSNAITRAVLVFYAAGSLRHIRDAWIHEFRATEDLNRIRLGLLASRGLVFESPYPCGVGTTHAGELQLSLRGGLEVTVWLNDLGFSREPGPISLRTTFESPELAQALLEGARQERGSLPAEVEGMLDFLAERGMPDRQPD
jgi:hypothetical protein